MNIKHCFKNGTKADTVKGHQLTKEKTEQIIKIIMEVKRVEKKST